ncbi:uncharacterized protein ALTATR162_LOCUS3897 [Alternaria atra]|uniref:Uncharacterized protein n=1 Tax=Alternaria atra TaxID=119953 RepID=A0A8J2N0H2_9PLEO|nr:uncharacterized protein ALTATR162_LOCUS3897 [Alternaria atra]CAG5155912.1 unnamed protein product [Alternaria atra]
MDLSSDLKDWLMHIINSQPHYNDVQGDLQGQFNARHLLGANTIPELARTIIAFRHEYMAIEDAIAIFAKLVQNAIDRYQDTTSFSSDHTTLDQYVNELVDHHRFLVSDPFSKSSLALRQQLALCDIRGTMRLLVWDAATLLDRSCYTGLSWDMFRNFVNGLIHVVNAREPACVDHVRTALFVLRLDCFLDPNALKDDTWVWLPEGEEYDYEPDEEVDLDDLPDVCFEPVGPSLKAEQHAFAVTKSFDLPEEDCSICRDMLDVHETVRDEVPVKNSSNGYHNLDPARKALIVIIVINALEKAFETRIGESKNGSRDGTGTDGDAYDKEKQRGR